MMLDILSEDLVYYLVVFMGLSMLITLFIICIDDRTRLFLLPSSTEL